MPMVDIFDTVSSGDIGSAMNSDAWNTWANAYKNSGIDVSKLNLGSLLATGAGGLAGLLGGKSSQKPTGYQGTVPVYTAVRQQVPMADQDPARRPGSGGRQYFTNTQFLPRSDAAAIAAATNAAQAQSNAIARANLAPTQGQRTAELNAAQTLFVPYRPGKGITSPYAPTTPAETTNTPSTAPTNTTSQDGEGWQAGDGGAARGGLIGYAEGGLANLGYYLGGQTDGMADKIPATIANKQPAKLSHGEFVISADVVSALGSGNSEAGAKVLYDMMDRVRKHAHGTKKQIKPANLKKTLPA